MPYITDQICFVHVPKCGGTWVAWYLQQEYRFGQIAKGHDPLALAGPEQLEGRLVVASLRDPWSWYMSWYSHARKRKGWTEALKVYGGGSMNYQDIIYGATHPTRDRCPEAPSVLVDYQHEREAFLESGVGLYSWMVRHLLGWPYQADVIIDLKSLRPGLESILKVKIDPTTYPHRNTGQKKGLRPRELQHETAMWGWINEADKEIIDLMGYVDKGIPARKPVVWL